MALKFNGFKAKRNFHTILNFVLFQKYEMYENKYRTKICDFTVILSNVGTGRIVGIHANHILIIFLQPTPSLKNPFSLLSLVIIIVHHFKRRQ